MIDLGAGRASSGETLCGRVISALKSEGLLSESVGAGYIERNWPPALQSMGAWPLSSLRQCFLNGTLTRLLDPDTVLKQKIVEFVGKGDFGLASGARPDATYARVWYNEPVSPDEVTFEADVYLLTKVRAEALKSGTPPPAPSIPPPEDQRDRNGTEPEPEPEPIPGAQTKTLRLVGTVPPAVWNRLGTRLIPKLRAGTSLVVRVHFAMTVDNALVTNVKWELQQALADLGLTDQVTIEEVP